MNHTRRFIVDASSNYLRMLATILGTVFLTHAMVVRWSVDDFGRWSLVTTVMSFSLLLDLGLSNIVMKAAADRDNKAAGTVLSSACMALLLMSVCACVFLSGATNLILPGSGSDILWVISALSLRATVASLPWTVCRSALYARGKMSVTNLVQSVGTVAYSTFACVALHRGAGLRGVACITLLFTVIDSLCLLALFKHYLPEIALRPSFNYNALRPLLSLGGASLLINIAGFILLKTDPLIVKTFLPFTQVAMYAVALRIAENVFLLCKQLVNALTPHAIRAGLERDTAQGRRIFERATRYVLALGVPMYVCALVVGRSAISLWLSPAYDESALILSILLLAMILSIPQLVGSNLLTFSGHHKKTATFITIGAFVNVVSSVILVHVTGASGVAYGTLFTTVLIDVLIVIPYTCYVLNVHLGRLLYTVFKGIVVPGAVQAAALTMMHAHLHPTSLLVVLLECAISCVVFLISFLFLGTASSEREGIVRVIFPAKLTSTSPVGA